MDAKGAAAVLQEAFEVQERITRLRARQKLNLAADYGV
jgi:hypothetical protein